jgi:hypothetical protein
MTILRICGMSIILDLSLLLYVFYIRYFNKDIGNKKFQKKKD